MSTIGVRGLIPSQNKNAMAKLSFTLCAIITLFLTISGCESDKKPVILSSSTTDIAANPDDATPGSLMQLATEKQRISLDLPDDILLRNISDVQVHDNLIYVKDVGYGGEKPAISVFDTMGEFIYRIAAWGRGPGEYEGIYSVAFTDNEIVFATRRNLTFYDIKTGTYQKTRNIKIDNGFLNWITFINDTLLVSHDERTRHNRDKQYLRVIDVERNKVIATADSFQNHALKISHNPRYFYEYEDTLSFISAYEPVVFRLQFDAENKELKMIPAFHFNFGDKWITEEYLADTYDNREEIFTNPLYIHTLVVYETENVLMATYNYEDKKYAVYYDKVGKRTTNIQLADSPEGCEIKATFQSKVLFLCEEGTGENLSYSLMITRF